MAPEGLLTDHMSKGSLIAAIGGTIEDYSFSHKETDYKTLWRIKDYIARGD